MVSLFYRKCGKVFGETQLAGGVDIHVEFVYSMRIKGRKFLLPLDFDYHTKSHTKIETLENLAHTF